ncbi:MAG: molybdenum cofactor biosynthesis protein B [Methanomicrobiaceae archaeon]|nr:molybdenum cofactor biosynthesis protein B [Methanomicrobiaceae archaeon]
MDPSHIRDIPVIAGIITVSTSRTEETDESGEKIRKLLSGADIPVFFYRVVPDSVFAIRTAIAEAMNATNCIVVSGGTGLTQDDITIEAVEPFLEKKMEGFGEIFRMLSYHEIGTRAVLSRAAAGLAGGKAVFCIPGSVNAVTLATERIIIPEIRHILTHASG